MVWKTSVLVSVNTYLGVRYGQPPVGAMRFKASQMAEAWPGIYDATQYPNRAMQEKTLSTLGLPVGGAVSEDCLFLNIYSPKTDIKMRPVLDWFYDGIFVAGSANEYDGSVLAEQGDVVGVTVNSRLGVFGFFDWSYFGSAYEGSASNGIRDQILALQWLRENIEDYGGDPGNVTIFGQSSGGSSVLALLAAPAADGLNDEDVASSAHRHSLARARSESMVLGLVPGLAPAWGTTSRWAMSGHGPPAGHAAGRRLHTHTPGIPRGF